MQIYVQLQVLKNQKHFYKYLGHEIIFTLLHVLTLCIYLFMHRRRFLYFSYPGLSILVVF